MFYFDASSMTSYVRIEEFLLAQGDWITYAERLSYYFKTNSITDANRKKPCYSQCVEQKHYPY